MRSCLQRTKPRVGAIGDFIIINLEGPPWLHVEIGLEPGGLQCMESLRVGHDWVTSLSLFTFMHWRRKWQATLVFLPGESQGWGSLVGCRLWGLTVTHDWSDLAAAAAIRRGFSGGSEVKKNLSAMQETQVWSLGQENPLKECLGAHSSILA